MIPERAGTGGTVQAWYNVINYLGERSCSIASLPPQPPVLGAHTYKCRCMCVQLCASWYAFPRKRRFTLFYRGRRRVLR